MFHQRIFAEAGYDLSTPGGRADFANALFDLAKPNGSSPLNYFYSPETCTLIGAYRSLACWMYQCSVPDSKLYQTMLHIRGDLAQEIVESLPDYPRGGWEQKT